MDTTADARRQRREQFNRLAAEDLTALDTLTLEYATLQSGNPLTADNIRLRLFRITETFGLKEFPRGYKVYGGTGRTAFYVGVGNSDTRATDGQLVADALTGWLTEIAEVLEKKVATARPRAIIRTEEGR